MRAKAVKKMRAAKPLNNGFTHPQDVAAAEAATWEALKLLNPTKWNEGDVVLDRPPSVAETLARVESLVARAHKALIRPIYSVGPGEPPLCRCGCPADAHDVADAVAHSCLNCGCRMYHPVDAA
jgi:hypothetical protein